MPRKKVEKNPVRRARLIQLMEETGTTQYALEKRTGIKQQNISAMVRESGYINLTERSAELIIGEFPEYRIQWLLGYDDFKTEADLLAHYFTQSNEKRTRTHLIFDLMATMSGWQIDNSCILGGAEYDPENDAMTDVNFFTWQFEHYASVWNGDTSVMMNENEFERFISKMLDYFSFELEHMT